MSGVTAMRNPECPNAANPALCRISRTVIPVEPAQDWNILYDGNGAATNEDPNVYIATSVCITCNQRWEIRWKGSEPPTYVKL